MQTITSGECFKLEGSFAGQTEEAKDTSSKSFHSILFEVSGAGNGGVQTEAPDFFRDLN